MSAEFTDARSCKEWLKAVPLTNVGQAQRQILEAVRALNRADFQPLERLTCMELLRDKVASVQAEQRVRHPVKSVPLSAPEKTLWDTSRQLVEEMESGYRKCLDAATIGSADVAPHIALIIQRVMRYIGLQMLFSGLVFRKFDSGLWTRLHLLWMEAESRALAQTKVKDSVGGVDGVSNIASAYMAILLAQLARPEEMSTRQLDLLNAVIKRFASKVETGLSPVTTKPGHSLSIDLFASAGASGDLNVEPGDHVRFLDVTALSKSLRARMAKLQEGESPANLDLPAEWTPSDMFAQIKRLHRLWCEPVPPRSAPAVPTESHATVCFGLEQLHYFLTGTVFEQPGQKRELSKRELNDIAMFGKVSEQTMKSLQVDVKFNTESWATREESRSGLKLVRRPDSAQGLAIGRLMGVRLGLRGQWTAAMVTAIQEESDGSHHATLALMPGALSAVAVRSADLRTRPGTAFVPALSLPAVAALGIEESLLIPSNIATPGRGLDIALTAQSQSKEVTVHEYIDRGIDFDRVTFF